VKACEPGRSRDQAPAVPTGPVWHTIFVPPSKMRTFRCAPWKRVRIFEGIIEVFQDAHSSKTVRIFEEVAHLRQGLGPRVPARGCSAVVESSRAGTCFGLDRDAWRRNDSGAQPRTTHRSAPGLSPGTCTVFAFSTFRLSPTSGAQQKSRTLTEGTAPLMRDLQLLAVPRISSFLSRIIAD
jgi:hypothetical protein